MEVEVLRHKYLELFGLFHAIDEAREESDQAETGTYQFFIATRKFIFSVIAADNYLAYSEYCAFKELFDDDDTYEELNETIEFYRETGQLDDPLENIGYLTSVIVAEDILKKSFIDKVVDFMRDVGVFFAAIDEDFEESEMIVIADYISTLQSAYKHFRSKTGPLIEAKENSDSEIKFTEKNSDSKDLDELILELNELIGLNKVKNEVNNLVNHAKVSKIRKERGLPVPNKALHLVFTGNPGTGKTTVARLISQIYCKLGLLSKGHLIETDRSGLVAGYVGQTALKVKEVVTSAIGGILFIDEAYSLSSGKDGNDYGREAIDTLLKLMEDNREDLVVIVAGYPDKMDEFIDLNPGLKSRFNNYIFFPDYSPEELNSIFNKMCSDNMLTISSEASQFNQKAFSKLFETRTAHFGNGRDVRNIFEHAMSNQANRLVEIDIDSASNELLSMLELNDVMYGFKSLLQSIKK